ncbi:hypothetical protein LCGC14_1018220 [marine sediment metagenome]|uniref:Uncharacterized protein n=1 Tax=marine sediment metagenome TaxID=412755 RepID=A0A0F9MY99_9ZZZZ
MLKTSKTMRNIIRAETDERKEWNKAYANKMVKEFAAKRRTKMDRDNTLPDRKRGISESELKVEIQRFVDGGGIIQKITGGEMLDKLSAQGGDVVIEEIRIEIPGRPVPWSVKVGRHGSHGTLVTPDHVLVWQQFAAAMARLAMKGRKPIEGAVKISLAAVFPIPKSWRKKKREEAVSGQVFHTVLPDATNILKATEDAFTKAGVWTDDSRVCLQDTVKLYGENPGVYVVVKEIEVAG